MTSEEKRTYYREYMKKWKHEHPEQWAVIQKRYQQKHRDRLRDYQREYKRRIRAQQKQEETKE